MIKQQYTNIFNHNNIIIKYIDKEIIYKELMILNRETKSIDRYTEEKILNYEKKSKRIDAKDIGCQ